MCPHADLRPVGTCGICVVDVEGIDEPSASCTPPAVPGRGVKTKMPRIDCMRRRAMQVKLASYPQDCVECSQYLNCELQSVKQYLGIAEASKAKRLFKPIHTNTRNPLFVRDFHDASSGDLV